jgi:hypothetical protein
MDMQDFKGFFQSRTVWANIVGILALIAAARGIDLGGEEANRLTEARLQIVSAGGFVASTVFRVLATRRIG